MTCPRALFCIRDNSLTCVYRDNLSRAPCIDCSTVYMCVCTIAQRHDVAKQPEAEAVKCVQIVRSTLWGIICRKESLVTEKLLESFSQTKEKILHQREINS